MKSYIKIVLASLLIGGVMALLFYLDIKREVNALSTSDGYVKVFQVGVFKNIDNAKNLAANYSSSQIYNDQSLYRVIIATTITNEDKLIALFNDLKIDYYIKEVLVDQKTYNELKNYDLALEKCTKEETIFILCKEMNELFLRNSL